MGFFIAKAMKLCLKKMPILSANRIGGGRKTLFIHINIAVQGVLGDAEIICDLVSGLRDQEMPRSRSGTVWQLPCPPYS